MGSSAGGEKTAPAAMEATAAASAATAATKPKKAKKRKTKTKGRMKAKAPSRLEGEALRDELMRRERREEARVLAVNTLFYRARAYNVSTGCRERSAVACSPCFLVVSWC